MPAIKFAQDKVLMLDDQGGAWVMDMSGNKPTFQQTGSLGEVRHWSNMVVLADGSVMVSGGSELIIKLVGVITRCEIWNPQTGVWTAGDAAAARPPVSFDHYSACPMQPCCRSAAALPDR